MGIFFLHFILCCKWSHISISGSQISTRHHCHPGYGWIVWRWQTDSCTCTKDPKIPFTAFPSCWGVYRSWWQTCSLEGIVYIVSCSTCYLYLVVPNSCYNCHICTWGLAEQATGMALESKHCQSSPSFLWYRFVKYLNILPQNSTGWYMYSKQDHGFV